MTDEPPPSASSSASPGSAGSEPESDSDSKQKAIGTKRGTETVFRTSYRTHMDLSSIADTKANIVIGINGLILSIILAGAPVFIGARSWMLLPVSVLLVTALTTTIFAVLSARPRIVDTDQTVEEMAESNTSLLFFGNFVHLSRQEYLEGMREMLSEKDRTYNNMILDLYGLGQVLRRKFRLLHVSYTVFMVGLTIAVVLFAALYWWHLPAPV